VLAAPGAWFSLSEVVLTDSSAGRTRFVPVTAGESAIAVNSGGIRWSVDRRYLLAAGFGAQDVIKPANARTVVRVGGDASDVAFIGRDRAVVFTSSEPCTFGKAFQVDFAAQTITPLRVDGVRDGIQVVASLDDTVVVAHRVPGDRGLTLDGVSAIDVPSGVARRISKHGTVAAFTTSPPRVWITSGARSRVMTLSGDTIARTQSVGAAAGIEGGRVAYAARGTPPGVVHIAGADGPRPADDPSFEAGGAVDQLIGGPGGDTVGVLWHDADRTHLDVCVIAERVCQTAFSSELASDRVYLIESVRTPVAT
jgi:hypothetical protein